MVLLEPLLPVLLSFQLEWLETPADTQTTDTNIRVMLLLQLIAHALLLSELCHGCLSASCLTPSCFASMPTTRSDGIRVEVQGRLQLWLLICSEICKLLNMQKLQGHLPGTPTVTCSQPAADAQRVHEF